jgi:DNA-binding transcriptional regulator of glucitol operon
MDGLLAFNGDEEEFEDLGVIEGDEENHDEGSRTIMSLTNKLGGMNMQPSLKNNGENYVVINHIPDDDEIMRKILEESIKTAEEEEKKRKQERGPSKEEEKGKEVQKEKEIASQSEQ